SNGALAMAFLPPPYNGGSLAGDVVISTTPQWHVNADYDLETVAIHELGHALGMDHSAISTAAMYAGYTGMKQALTSDDSSGIQSLYGVRQPDQFDAGIGNNVASTATLITPYLNSAGQAVFPSLDITTATDYDWFYVTVPAG